MPITLPIATLIAGAVGGTATAIGVHGASKANNTAAQLEADYNNRALEAAQKEQDYQHSQDALKIARDEDERQYQRWRYKDYLTAFEPYAAAGRSALTTATAGVNANPYAHLTDGSGSPSATPANRYAGFANGGGDQMVTLRAPDGTTQAVPASAADHYLSRGAVRV